MPFAVVHGVPSKMLAELGSLHCPQSARPVSEALKKRRGRFHGALITSVRDYVALWIRRPFFRAELAVEGA